MSFTKKYHNTITVEGRVTGNCSCGKHISYDYTQDVPVDINIHVDTDPFDQSVHQCSQTVNRLTGAVVATEAAQVISINKNSKKIANSIVSGFFGYIRYEISQQVAELKQNLDAQLMHLRELAMACIKKKDQMASDYYRIAERYLKIFTDLDHELDHRIGELDKPAFVFKKETDSQQNRFSGTDLLNTVTIFGTECSRLQSQISVSVTKKRALDTLTQARTFLWQQKRMNATIQQSMINENVSASKSMPVCFIETNDDKNQVTRNLFFPEFVDTFRMNKNMLVEQFTGGLANWTRMAPGYHENIARYFNSELDRTYFSAEPHTARVKETIQRMADLNSINVIKAG